MTLGAPVSPASPDRTFDPPLRRLSLVVAIGAVMSVLDTTIVNVAINTFTRVLHSTLTTIQWVSTAYLLALALVIPLTGWAIERFGAKRLWIASLALFLTGSALAGAAWSAESLIAFRVLQGIGGGMILPIGQSMLASAAGPERMGRVMSVLGVPALIGPVLGPVLGGFLIDQASWRWIFYVNIPIGIVGIALSIRLLAPDPRRDARAPIDLLGLVFLSPGLAALLYGLTEAGSGHPLQIWLPVGLGCLSIVAFVLRSLHTPAPLLDVRLFANKVFLGSAMLSFGFAAALFGAMLLLPLYFQVARGESAFDTGLILVTQGIGAGLMIPIAGRLTDTRGPRQVILPGLIVATVSTAVLTQVHAHTSYGVLAVTLFIRGAGFGCIMMPTMAAAYYSLRADQVPRATTAINIVQRIGGSVGVAVLAVVLQRQLTSRLPGNSGSRVIGAVLPPGVREHIAAPLAAAFGASFWWSVAFVVASLIPAFLLPNRPPSAKVQVPQAPVGQRVTELPIALEG